MKHSKIFALLLVLAILFTLVACNKTPTMLTEISAVYGETELELGNDLDRELLVVTAHYSDKTEKEVFDYNLSYDFSSTGQKKVLISYAEGKITKTTHFNVNIVEPPIPDEPNEGTLEERLREQTSYYNFASRSEIMYDNINDKTVTVDLFYRYNGEIRNNPNVGVGIMLYQCILYKQAHPEQEVYISLTSFHLSTVAATGLVRGNGTLGRMTSLFDEEYTEVGFVRISYLLVCAAKLGINVTVVGQIDANPTIQNGHWKSDIPFDEYFQSHMDDESVIEGKKVGDFLTFRKAKWTSYGDKAASDMMHNKTCTVSHYIDCNGREHGAATWVSSTNLDGIHQNGTNGNDNVQTGIIVSDHEELRKVVYNYTALMAKYCEQEEIAEFRDKVSDLNKTQIDLILAGRENEIPAGEQIVYLGGEKDPVFEMYFTPLGGSVGKWDANYNPFSKYIGKLLPAISGSDSITFAWNNAKYLTNFEFSQTLQNVLYTAFTQNTNLNNKLYLRLVGYDYSLFDSLVENENIGRKFINKQQSTHAKDFQLSYVENGVRHYVTAFSTLNFHQGSMWYQTNSVLIVNETAQTNNRVYVEFGKMATYEVINDSDKSRN